MTTCICGDGDRSRLLCTWSFNDVGIIRQLVLRATSFPADADLRCSISVRACSSSGNFRILSRAGPPREVIRQHIDHDRGQAHPIPIQNIGEWWIRLQSRPGSCDFIRFPRAAFQPWMAVRSWAARKTVHRPAADSECQAIAGFVLDGLDPRRRRPPAARLDDGSHCRRQGRPTPPRRCRRAGCVPSPRASASAPRDRRRRGSRRPVPGLLS